MMRSSERCANNTAQDSEIHLEQGKCTSINSSPLPGCGPRYPRQAEVLLKFLMHRSRTSFMSFSVPQSQVLPHTLTTYFLVTKLAYNWTAWYGSSEMCKSKLALCTSIQSSTWTRVSCNSPKTSCSGAKFILKPETDTIQDEHGG